MWVTNDIIRFCRAIDDQWFVGELQLSTGKIDLRPTSIPIVDLNTESFYRFYWSARGTYLAISQSGNSQGLWLYDVRTGGLKGISTPGRYSSFASGIAWTADESSMLALVHGEEAPVGEGGYVARVVRVDLPTLSSVKIADLPRGLWSGLALSPGGDVVLVSRTRFPGSPDSPTLFTVDLASGRIAESTLLGDRPEWSPDGSLVAYGAVRASLGDSGLWVAPSSLTGARRIAAWPSFEWLPDGKHLLLSDMTIVDVNSGEIKDLKFSGEQPPRPSEQFGPLSPDGKKILWVEGKRLGMIALGE